MYFPFIDFISKNTSARLLNRLIDEKLFPMVYHLVGNADELLYANGLYRIPSEKEFEAELDFLLKHYKPISLKELYTYTQTKDLPGKDKYFFLTFDDGLRQCSEIIAPILLRKGVPATFFINTGFVDNKDFIFRFRSTLLADKIKKDKTELLKSKVEEFFNVELSCRYKAAKYVLDLKWSDRDKIRELDKFLELGVEKELLRQKPYMSTEQISDLVRDGFTVGSHSVDHPEYSYESEDIQIEQTKVSLQNMAEWFNPDLNTFAFPFTDYGVKEAYFDRLKNEAKVDITFGSAGLKEDIIKNHIHRIPMDDRQYGGEQRLKYELLYYLLKKPFGKNKIKQR